MGKPPKKRGGGKHRRRTPREPIPTDLIPTVAESTMQRLERALYAAKEQMQAQGFGAKHQLAMSRDYIVDSQLTIEIPRGVDAKSVLTRVESALRPFPAGTWVSVGVMVPLRPQEVASGRYAIFKRGLTHAGTYYRPGGSWAHAIATGKQVVGNFANKGRRKPTSVFVRIHWNPHDVKPTREG